jgi:hypothetical protein
LAIDGFLAKRRKITRPLGMPRRPAAAKPDELMDPLRW